MDAAEGETESFMEGSSLCPYGSDGKGAVLFTGKYFQTLSDFNRDQNDNTRFLHCACPLNSLTMFLVLEE